MKGLYIFFLPIILFLALACSKEVSINYFEIGSTELTMYATQQLQIPASVSFSGTDTLDMIWSSDNEKVAIVNKNGVVNALQPGDATISVKCQQFERKCKVVVEAQTYFVGVQNNTTYNSIALCSNGAFSTITTSQYDANPTDIDVKKTDIYISGSAKSLAAEGEIAHAAYWKNGAIVLLNQDVESESVSNGIFVENDTIYNVGVVGNSALFWKNTNATILSENGNANDIKVHHKNTYVVGYERNSVTSTTNASIWINGEKQILPGENSEARSVALDTINNNIYVAGLSEINGIKKATIWKNGVAEVLSIESAFESIAYYDDKIYACGNETYSPYNRPFVFKDNSLTYLDSGMNNINVHSISANTLGYFVVGAQNVFNEITSVTTIIPLIWNNNQINYFESDIINLTPTSIFTR